MINQIHAVKTKTEALPTINKGLLQARHIQARLHQQGTPFGFFGQRCLMESFHRRALSGPGESLDGITIF